MSSLPVDAMLLNSLSQCVCDPEKCDEELQMQEVNVGAYRDFLPNWH
jgi:hypothetical protein|tara:strand:- start:16960 stop:17100 length:141 start_codon:yes stop_codon:yes gene_type:complete